MIEKLKVLVAEDDANIREGLLDALSDEGYEARGAADGIAALRHYAAWHPDLILLDVMMPGKSGYDVCREIRRGNRRLPIIMLTAKGEEIDKVLGLELGADDYVTKPFGLKELFARIAAVLRRARDSDEADPASPPVPDELALGDVCIHFRRMQGERDGQIFPLTRIELGILRVLAERAGEAVSRRDIIQRVWGPGLHGCTRKLDQQVAQIRKKLEADPAHPAIIASVYGVGYRLSSPLPPA